MHVLIASMPPPLLTVDASSDCKCADTWGDSPPLPQLWNELVQTSLLMPSPQVLWTTCITKCRHGRHAHPVHMDTKLAASDIICVCSLVVLSKMVTMALMILLVCFGHFMV